MHDGLIVLILETLMSNLFKRQVYAGIMEIIKDQKYYYNSGIGSRYDHLTEDGTSKLKEFINIMAPHMLEIEKKELEELAKKLVVEELKK